MAGITVRPSRYVDETDLQQKLLKIIGNDTTRKGVNQIIAELTEPYVPKKSGTLRESLKVGPKVIIYGSGLAYARYQFMGEVYGPNLPITSGGIIVGWRSIKGDTKVPTGRELGIPGEWRGWKFGYTTPGTKHHWFQEMLEHDKRVMQIRITNYLKKRAKEV